MSSVATEILQVQKKDRPLLGIETWINPKNGFRVIDLEYTADPDKRSEEFVLQQRAGMPKADYAREYGKKWTVYDGKPVYQDFDEDIHVLKGNIVVPPRCKLISGYDGGPNDVNLAWVLGVVIPPLSVLFIDELYIDNGDLFSFVEIISSRLQLEWLKLGGFSIHICDPSVFTPSNTTRDHKSMADIMRQYGLNPTPGEVAYGKRRASVERLMLTMFKFSSGNMVPKLRIHERCEFLIQAMGGGYAYPKIAGGIGGDYKPAPIKNRFSHIANAMEYASTRLDATEDDVAFEGRRLPRVQSYY